MADDLKPKTPAEHQQMGLKVARMVEEGKGSVPEEPNPLVCKPRELEPWRVFKIMSEFVEGFELLQKHALAASFFGTTRATFDSKLYQDATDLAARLSKRGFSIITGGASGIMEAANRGAFEAGGASVGLNIRLADNQSTNRYVTEQLMFDHFFVRKVMLTFASEVYIYFPGGFGTMDEFTEILTLVQTRNIKKIPIVLYGKEYWTPVLHHFKTKLYEQYHAIDEADMDLYKLVDSVDEAYEYIVANTQC